MKNLKNLLTTKNLMASYYDNGDDTYDLEFALDGKTVFVRVRGLDIPDDDEFYWDNEENLKKALEEADEEDFEVKYEEMTVLELSNLLTRELFEDICSYGTWEENIFDEGNIVLWYGEQQYLLEIETIKKDEEPLKSIVKITDIEEI